MANSIDVGLVIRLTILKELHKQWPGLCSTKDFTMLVLKKLGIGYTEGEVREQIDALCVQGYVVDHDIGVRLTPSKIQTDIAKYVADNPGRTEEEIKKAIGVCSSIMESLVDNLINRGWLCCDGEVGSLDGTYRMRRRREGGHEGQGAS